MVTDDEVNGLPIVESTPIAPEYETHHDPDWHHGEDLDVDENWIPDDGNAFDALNEDGLI